MNKINIGDKLYTSVAPDPLNYDPRPKYPYQVEITHIDLRYELPYTAISNEYSFGWQYSLDQLHSTKAECIEEYKKQVPLWLKRRREELDNAEHMFLREIADSIILLS